MRTKLWPPCTRAGVVPRARLDSLLEAGLQGKLCLVGAPAGFGKTTLLAHWCAAERGRRRVAWLSLDAADNDLIRFWIYVVEAFRTVEPKVGAAVLKMLQSSTVALDRAVLPRLLNEVATLDSELVLVLDDYHLIGNPVCHQTLAFFIDHLPGNLHVVLSSRADPPLPLGRMRARGELAEIRVAELRFTGEEASALLNASMRLHLAADNVERLTERTEGWAAGLYLAGLSLREVDDPGAFIASFQGDHRHVADYLGAEVLAWQSNTIRTFLLRTSILERLSGPLCDAVLQSGGSPELLSGLEHSNLFLVPLDDRRQWYRYHHLFAQLLRVELANSDGELVSELHQRAARWYRDAGDIDQAIHHATAAGNVAEAGALIAQHWLAYMRRGQLATVARWLDGLPDDEVAADPPLAVITSWVATMRGASKREAERWLTAASRGSYQGPLPDGTDSLPLGVAIMRAIFLFDDVGRSLGAAQRAIELAGPEPSQFRWIGVGTLGRGLYLSGRSAEARRLLEAVVGSVSAADQPYIVVNALALLSLMAGDAGDDQAAMTLARRGTETAEALGLSYSSLCGLVYVALGRALASQGEPAQAEEQLRRALELLGIDGMLVHRVQALLVLAPVRQVRGDVPGAHAVVGRARELIEGLTDPGILPSRLVATERSLRSAPRRRVETAAPLTERELTVLRLLASDLSQREIGRELYVSVNTVRTHAQALYRKLGVTSRGEAVGRARDLGLVPRSTRTYR
ncbi:MAG TPA: LuxR C-terminal-related transcriptional regulator [Actinomycetes bacterium]|nr:LuxR C-terminal-related transcriptional regulator [Actinomycetes bacterium]